MTSVPINNDVGSSAIKPQSNLPSALLDSAKQLGLSTTKEEVVVSSTHLIASEAVIRVASFAAGVCAGIAVAAAVLGLATNPVGWGIAAAALLALAIGAIIERAAVGADDIGEITTKALIGFGTGLAMGITGGGCAALGTNAAATAVPIIIPGIAGSIGGLVTGIKFIDLSKRSGSGISQDVPVDENTLRARILKKQAVEKANDRTEDHMKVGEEIRDKFKGKDISIDEIARIVGTYNSKVKYDYERIGVDETIKTLVNSGVIERDDYDIDLFRLKKQ